MYANMLGFLKFGHIWLLHFARTQLIVLVPRSPDIFNTHKKRGGAWCLTSRVTFQVQGYIRVISEHGWQALNISLNPRTVAAIKKVNVSVFTLFHSTHTCASIVFYAHTYA